MKMWTPGSVPVICCRPDDPYRVVVPGAVECACWECGVAVMVEPATLEKLPPGRPGLTICVQCYRLYVDLTSIPHTLIQM